MQPVDPQRVAAELGVPAGAVSLIHAGENLSYRVGGEVARVVRLYRPGRRSAEEIEAEWAWVDALQSVLRSPQARRDERGRAVREVAGHRAVLMDWMPGTPVSLGDVDAMRAIGQMIGALQREAAAIAERQPASWPGHSRPRVELHADLRRAVAVLADSGIATGAQEQRMARLADVVSARLERDRFEPTDFVHGDLHAGNLLWDGSALGVLDFDDSVWAPPELEWATLRIHLRAQQRFDQAWPTLVAAAGTAPSPWRTALVTAAHALSIIARFPEHLDLEAFADPPAVVERYLGYASAELAELESR